MTAFRETVAPIEEIQLYVRGRERQSRRCVDARNSSISITMGATVSRVDLHISRTGDGELLLTSRQDGGDPDARAGLECAPRLRRASADRRQLQPAYYPPVGPMRLGDSRISRVPTSAQQREHEHHCCCGLMCD